jgi:hypothetical protein
VKGHKQCQGEDEKEGIKTWKKASEKLFVLLTLHGRVYYPNVTFSTTHQCI